MANTVLEQSYKHQERTWAGLFILIAMGMGALLLLLPVHLVLGLVVAAVAAIYLVLNPVRAFQAVIFTIPFTERIRVLPVSFSPNDLMILFTGIVVLGHAIFAEKRTSLRTKLDPWIGVLTVLFFLAGYFSASSRGLLGFFKWTEAVAVYYMLIWFIRTHQLTRAMVIRTVLVTALVQAAIGILQSLTGGFGADFQSQRGYLGYLGLGSSTVWHGKGTMGHFNTLGNFLVTNFLFFLPLYFYVVTKETRGKLIGLTLLMAMIMTYSRGSLLGLIAGSLFFISAIQKNPKHAAVALGAAVMLFVVPAFSVFGNSSYVSTLSFTERLMVWRVPMAAITQSAKTIWLGNGLNSYEVVAWPYIPANIPKEQYHNWFAHNFYLLSVLEMGILGALTFFSFFVYVWLDTWKRYRASHGLDKIYSLAMSVAVISIFFVSIFDHSYNSPYFKVYLFLILGLLYVKSFEKTRHTDSEPQYHF